jgi:hypothetical protein
MRLVSDESLAASDYPGALSAVLGDSGDVVGTEAQVFAELGAGDEALPGLAT